MPLFQTKYAKRKATPPGTLTSGALASVTYTYAFDAAFTAATDKIEFGTLPATAQLHSATVIGEGLGINTATVGLMSGIEGVVDDARIVGNELFNAVSVNDTEQNATALACLNLAPDSAVHRPLGATLSADVAAGAAKRLHLVITYYE